MCTLINTTLGIKYINDIREESSSLSLDEIYEKMQKYKRPMWHGIVHLLKATTGVEH